MRCGNWSINDQFGRLERNYDCLTVCDNKLCEEGEKGYDE